MGESVVTHAEALNKVSISTVCQVSARCRLADVRPGLMAKSAPFERGFRVVRPHDLSMLIPLHWRIDIALKERPLTLHGRPHSIEKFQPLTLTVAHPGGRCNAELICNIRLLDNAVLASGAVGVVVVRRRADEAEQVVHVAIDQASMPAPYTEQVRFGNGPTARNACGGCGCWRRAV